MDALCASLLSWAVTLSPYGDPGYCPEIVFKGSREIREQACDEVEKCPNPIYGLYQAPYDRVYINENLNMNTASGRAVVVHEIVHWLQYLENPEGSKGCRNVHEREREAIRIQNEYLVRHGSPGVGPSMAFCTAED